MTRGRTPVPTPGPPPVSEADELDADRAAPLAPTELADLEASRAARRESDWCPQDIVEEWGFQSFPASDAPANW